MFGNTETITIGSIGFAQLGMPDYYEKRQVEKKVLIELLNTPTFENLYPELCRIKIVTERYEDSSYDEVGIVYDYRKMSNLEDNDEEKYNEFWEEFKSHVGALFNKFKSSIEMSFDKKQTVLAL